MYLQSPGTMIERTLAWRSVRELGTPTIKPYGSRVSQPRLRALAKQESRSLLGKEKEDIFNWRMWGGKTGKNLPIASRTELLGIQCQINSEKSKAAGVGYFCLGFVGLSHRASGLLLWSGEQALSHVPFSAAGFQGNGREELNSLFLAFCICTRMADNTLVMVLRFIRKKIPVGSRDVCMWLLTGGEE